MKKLLILILCSITLLISACSKEDNENEQTSSSQTEGENKKQEAPASVSGQEKEDAKETAASEEEGTESEPTAAEEDTANSEDEKEYLTSHHQFVASELTNLSEKEVSSLWGPSIRSEKIKFRYSGTSNFVPAVVHHYQDEKYAVTFVEGKAARLVYSVIDEEILFDDEKTKALELAGLPADVEETTDTDTAFVWNDIGDVYQVTMFSKGEFADYLYIILDEAYK